MAEKNRELPFRKSIPEEGVSGKKGTQKSEERRQKRLEAILLAAFEVFSAKGFSAARLEDVAASAGIAKGTIYLYFSSKHELFAEMIRSSFTASFDLLEGNALKTDLSVEQIMAVFMDWFQKEILLTRRREMLWLILREAKQFPELAKVHHELVISRAMNILRLCSANALQKGDIRSDALLRFPQIAIAPALLAVVWMELFQDIEPLDAGGMLQSYRDLLLRGLKGNDA